MLFIPSGDATVEASLQQLHHQQQTSNSLASAVSAVRNKGKRKSSSHLSSAMHHSLPPHTLQTQLDKMLTDRMLNLAESQKKFVADQTTSIFYSGSKQQATHHKRTLTPQPLPADLSIDYSTAVKTNGGSTELQHNNNNNHRNNNNGSPGGMKGNHIKTERLSPVELTTLPSQSAGSGLIKNGDSGGVNRRSR